MKAWVYVDGYAKVEADFPELPRVGDEISIKSMTDSFGTKYIVDYVQHEIRHGDLTTKVTINIYTKKVPL